MTRNHKQFPMVLGHESLGHPLWAKIARKTNKYKNPLSSQKPPSVVPPLLVLVAVETTKKRRRTMHLLCVAVSADLLALPERSLSKMFFGSCETLSYRHPRWTAIHYSFVLLLFGCASAGSSTPRFHYSIVYRLPDLRGYTPLL